MGASLTAFAVIEMKVEIGFRQSAGQGLAGFQLEDLVGQIVRGPRIGGSCEEGP